MSYILNPGVSYNQSLYTEPNDGFPVTPHAITWKVLLPATGGMCDGGEAEVVLGTSYLKLGWDVTGDPASGSVAVTMPEAYSLPAGRTIQVYAYEALEGCCGGQWNEYIGTVIGEGDIAAFVSQTVNLAMYANGTQQVTVNFQNVGNTTWDSEGGDPYNLGSQNGQDNTRWGMNRVALPQTISPGETASFVFTITAPGSAGTYAFQWGMVHDGVAWFSGHSTNQSIVVSSAPAPPSTPGQPTFSSTTDTTATVTLPALPSGATSLTLQRSASGASSWSSLATGQAGAATYNETGRTPGVTYDYRIVAVGGGGSTNGTLASLTMYPAAPSDGTVSGITSSALTVTLPSLPAGASSLKLQRSASGANSWSDRATGQDGGAEVSETGLSASTTYDYRVVAVGAAGNTNGSTFSATTSAAAPSAPDVPMFSNVAATSLTVTLPSLPSGAATLTLQRSASGANSWSNRATGQAGGATFNETGLGAETTYDYRVVAVGAGGSTSGTLDSVTTDEASGEEDAVVPKRAPWGRPPCQWWGF